MRTPRAVKELAREMRPTLRQRDGRKVTGYFPSIQSHVTSYKTGRIGTILKERPREADPT